MIQKKKDNSHKKNMMSAMEEELHDEDVDNDDDVNNNHSHLDVSIDELIDLESPYKIAPKTPSKCPVFCCFYAEFDIKKGPVVRFQCPKGFMNLDINQISTPDIHTILANTFATLRHKGVASATSTATATEGDEDLVDKCDNANKSTGEEVGNISRTEDMDDDYNNNPVAEQIIPVSTPPQQTKAKKESILQDLCTSTSNGDDNIPTYEDVKSTETGGQSIFDATCEYIITGSELTGKVITLSTHDMHVMTRPTQITDERYERNALLFSIGFLLRRAADPRPFRPLISKLALTLRSMEIESGILSDPTKVRRLQPLLERILLSMNSPRWECNLLLDKSTALNLKLFHPPKPQASPVHEYQVPILLRRDLQLQTYEWDLAINWVILHIDGIATARQISIKAEVDLEMVLACLRVLKHHGVISVVDMFAYTNRYEFTEKAAAMLAGKDDKLLHEAASFAMKCPAIHIPAAQNLASAASVGGASIVSVGSDQGIAPVSPKAGSPYFPSSALLLPGTPGSSYPPRSLNLLAAGGSQRSTNFRFAMLTATSLEREAAALGSRQQDDRKHLKTALAELYCACNRHLSFGDLWLSLTIDLPPSLLIPLISSNKTPSMPQRGPAIGSGYQRNVSNRRDSITEMEISENDAAAFSPVEASLLEAMRNSRLAVVNTSNSDEKCAMGVPSSSSNWKDIFKEFDHRRFISFGVVHGLLVRCHSYPFFSGTFPEIRSDAWNNSSVIIPSESASRHPINSRHDILEEKSFQLAKAVALAMDGTKCDDELVCKFERPLNKLVDLVEKFSGKKVVHVYASRISSS